MVVLLSASEAMESYGECFSYYSADSSSCKVHESMAQVKLLFSLGAVDGVLSAPLFSVA